MAGDGNETLSGESDVSPRPLDLPKVLVQLDDTDPRVRREAVERIESVVDEAPETCVPTVPKLRQLLDRELSPCHESVTYCLAELASESPEDVVPSVEAIVSFARSNTPHPGTTHALRALTHVANAQPEPVVEYVEPIASVVKADDGIDRWAIRLFETLSTRNAPSLEPVLPVLTDALEHDDSQTRATAARTIATIARETERTPDSVREALVGRLEDEYVRVRTNAAIALGYGGDTTVEPKLERMATVDPNPVARTRAAWALTQLS